MLPEVERALLAGHDLVLLGERGQGKTRLVRTLVGLLDEWTPVRRGLRDQRPPVRAGLRALRAARRGAAATTTPVAWKHRSERYGEKLATPDTSVGDLIGDVDPIKVAEGRTLGDPETVHYGLVPRTNRGIFSVNELPDLAERIQVALLNVLEERDIQVRGYTLRLPLDLLVVASANPEDYTNRGRIITPLKDRFGAEVRTHYPLRLEDELRVMRAGGAARLGPGDRRRRARPPARDRRPLHPAGARQPAGRPALRRLGPLRRRRHRDGGRLGRAPRRRDRRAHGGRARLRPAVGRARLPRQGRVRVGRGGPRARGARAPAAQGDRRHVPRPAGRADLSGLQGRFAQGATVETGDLVPAADAAAALGPVPGLAQLLRGSASRRSRRGWPPPRSSSPSRGCTSTAGSPRTRSPAGRSTAADVDDPPTAPARTDVSRCAGGCCSPAVVTLVLFLTVDVRPDRRWTCRALWLLPARRAAVGPRRPAADAPGARGDRAAPAPGLPGATSRRGRTRR